MEAGVGEEFWLWLGTAVMLAGGAAALATGKQRTPGEQSHTIYHGVVPIIAACSYFAMAVGQGSLILPLGAAADAGRIFYFARYIDWTFTTPLLLLSLAHSAMHSGMRRSGMVAGMLLADVMMILTSLFFGASEVVWIKWTWFLVSCVAFLAVYYVIWGPMLAESRKERAEVQADYRRNAVILSVLWLIYPLILAVSTDGLSVISSTTGVALIAILDVVSKVVYGLYAVAGTTKLTSEDLSEASSPGRLAMGTAD